MLRLELHQNILNLSFNALEQVSEACRASGGGWHQLEDAESAAPPSCPECLTPLGKRQEASRPLPSTGARVMNEALNQGVL